MGPYQCAQARATRGGHGRVCPLTKTLPCLWFNWCWVRVKYMLKPERSAEDVDHLLNLYLQDMDGIEPAGRALERSMRSSASLVAHCTAISGSTAAASRTDAHDRPDLAQTLLRAGPERDHLPGLRLGPRLVFSHGPGQASARNLSPTMAMSMACLSTPRCCRNGSTCRSASPPSAPAAICSTWCCGTCRRRRVSACSGQRTLLCVLLRTGAAKSLDATGVDDAGTGTRRSRPMKTVPGRHRSRAASRPRGPSFTRTRRTVETPPRRSGRAR